MKRHLLGVRRSKVRLLPHTDEWRFEFKKTARRMQRSLGGKALGVEHVGSTSVPGLHAKPIIDMSLGIARLSDYRMVRKPLAMLGFKLVREPSALYPHALYVKGTDQHVTHHLHVMRYGGAMWKRDIRFRNYLRTHPDRAKQYAALKKELAEKHANDRTAYTAGKKRFIASVLKDSQNR